MVNQVAIQGGPTRKSPEIRNRALETAERAHAPEKGPQHVDKTQFSRELVEETSKAGDPTGNVDQMILAMQGVGRPDQVPNAAQKKDEVGATNSISGDAKKQKPRIERTQVNRSQRTHERPAAQQKPPQQQGQERPQPLQDRVDISAEARVSP